MPLIDFLAAILACNQVVEIWNHGSIFATRRAQIELSDGWFASLLRCMFCLSVWVGWLVCLAVLAANYLPGFLSFNYPTEFLTFPLRLFVYGLAVSRAANLINDLLYDRLRTPKQTLEDLELEGESEDDDDVV